MRRIIMSAVVGALLAAGGFGTGAVAEGSEVQRQLVPGGTTHTYTRYFRAGERVTVAVSGDGDTDLDLYVRCPQHNTVVARDDDALDDCVVVFRAPESGLYRIQVVNRGFVSNAYGILID
jgi:hypothetical protein